MSIFPNTYKSLLSTFYFLLSKGRGFTLLEILVVIGVFAFITGSVLFNFTGFTSKIALDNVTQDIALSIREAQVYGIAAKEKLAGSNVFPIYGIHLEASKPTNFVLFADTLPVPTPDRKYAGSMVTCTVEECIKIINIEPGYEINNICGVELIGGNCVTLTKLDISFERPNPEATLVGTPPPASPNTPFYALAKITIYALRGGYTRTITVHGNGQIATTETE